MKRLFLTLLSVLTFSTVYVAAVIAQNSAQGIGGYGGAVRRSGDTMTGTLRGTGFVADQSSTGSIYANNSGNLGSNSFGYFSFPADGSYKWSNNAGTNAVTFATEANNVFAQRNGVNPQQFNLYNTYTDGANYERGVVQWSGNVLTVGAQAAGTGLARAVSFVGNGFTFNGSIGVTNTAAIGGCSVGSNVLCVAGAISGSTTISAGTAFLASKVAAAGTAPGAATARLEVVAGTTAGTCKLQMYAGTSVTPTTIIDNVGAGC